MDTDFPSNSKNVTDKSSKKQAPVKKEITKVVSGQVKQRSKPLGQRFKDIFFGGEFKGASHYITYDVMLPALKNMVVDATSKGIERVIYGETQPRRRSYSDNQGRPRVSYNNPMSQYPSGRPAMLPGQPPHTIGRRPNDSSQIILASKDEADLVLERLQDIIDTYDQASVADLKELVGLQSSYVDNKWGWTNLLYSGVQQVRDGFLIDLPPTEPIE